MKEVDRPTRRVATTWMGILISLHGAMLFDVNLCALLKSSAVDTLTATLVADLFVKACSVRCNACVLLGRKTFWSAVEMTKL